MLKVKQNKTQVVFSKNFEVRISKLTTENRKALQADITEALENRLRIFEKVEGILN